MTLQQFSNQAIRLAVPFVEKGRDWSGWDCWGLLYVAYKEVYGLEIQRFDDAYETTRARHHMASLFQRSIEDHVKQDLDTLTQKDKEKWFKVDKAEPGDGIIFRVMGRLYHVGLVLDNRHFIHCEEKIGTEITELSNPIWQKREGYYRHVARSKIAEG